MSGDEGERPRVAAVSIKLPPFWPADPNIWFAQVETQFATKGATNQKTMFDYVVTSVSPDITTEIRDLILTPPTENQYRRLKEELIRRTATSQQQRIQQLLSTEDIGDRKPTQLLHRLQQLASNTILYNGVFLRELFLQHLPANVRIVLASTNDGTPITELAQLADKVMEVAIPVVSKVSLQSPAQPSPTEVELLQGKVVALEQEIKSLQQATRTQLPRHRSPSPRQYSTPNSAGNPLFTICWYHQNFGASAKKCRPSCSYSGNDSAKH